MSAPKSQEVLVTPRVDLRKTLADIVRFRELFLFLAWRDFHVRYRTTYLGLAWALARPLAASGLLAAVGTRILHDRAARPEDLLIAMAGWIPFQTLSQAVTNASGNIMANLPIFGKVYFPRIFAPLSAVLIAVLDGCIALALFLALAAVGGELSVRLVLLAGIAMALTALASTGVSLILASMVAAVRDVAQALPFAMQCLLLGTPAVYGSTSLSGSAVVNLNPISLPIGLLRSGLRPMLTPERDLFYVYGVVSTLLLVAGAYAFLRIERRLPDMV